MILSTRLDVGCAFSDCFTLWFQRSSNGVACLLLSFQYWHSATLLFAAEIQRSRIAPRTEAVSSCTSNLRFCCLACHISHFGREPDSISSIKATIFFHNERQAKKIDASRICGPLISILGPMVGAELPGPWWIVMYDPTYHSYNVSFCSEFLHSYQGTGCLTCDGIHHVGHVLGSGTWEVSQLKAEVKNFIKTSCKLHKSWQLSLFFSVFVFLSSIPNPLRKTPSCWSTWYYLQIQRRTSSSSLTNWSAWPLVATGLNCSRFSLISTFLPNAKGAYITPNSKTKKCQWSG